MSAECRVAVGEVRVVLDDMDMVIDCVGDVPGPEMVSEIKGGIEPGCLDIAVDLCLVAFYELESHPSPI